MSLNVTMKTAGDKMKTLFIHRDSFKQDQLQKDYDSQSQFDNLLDDLGIAQKDKPTINEIILNVSSFNTGC